MGRHKQLTLLAVFMLAVSVHGQQAGFKPEVAMGGSFGMGVSSVSFVPTIQQKQLLGYHAGITVRWITESYLGLQAEVNLSQQGWSELFEDPQYMYSRRLNYVDVPFLTHIHTKGKRVRLFVNLGPKVGFLLSESSSENVIASPPPSEGQSQRTEQWTLPVKHTFAWGLCGGPGLELRTRIGIFQIEARYYYALGDIFANRRADVFPKSSSQVISGKLSYLLNL